MSTRVCEWCGRPESPGVDGVNDDAWCDVKGRRHRIVARLRPETGLGLTVKATAPAKAKRSGFTPASDEQKAKRKELQPFCIHCGKPATDSMHIIPRGMHTGGQEDPRATVSGCRSCHRSYDSGGISLLEDLEMHGREELAFAVERVGLIVALQRITNRRWAPVQIDEPGEQAA